MRDSLNRPRKSGSDAEQSVARKTPSFHEGPDPVPLLSLVNRWGIPPTIVIDDWIAQLADLQAADDELLAGMLLVTADNRLSVRQSRASGSSDPNARRCARTLFEAWRCRTAESQNEKGEAQPSAEEIKHHAPAQQPAGGDAGSNEIGVVVRAPTVVGPRPGKRRRRSPLAWLALLAVTALLMMLGQFFGSDQGRSNGQVDVQEFADSSMAATQPPKEQDPGFAERLEPQTNQLQQIVMRPALPAAALLEDSNPSSSGASETVAASESPTERIDLQSFAPLNLPSVQPLQFAESIDDVEDNDEVLSSQEDLQEHAASIGAAGAQTVVNWPAPGTEIDLPLPASSDEAAPNWSLETIEGDVYRAIADSSGQWELIDSEKHTLGLLIARSAGQWRLRADDGFDRLQFFGETTAARLKLDGRPIAYLGPRRIANSWKPLAGGGVAAAQWALPEQTASSKLTLALQLSGVPKDQVAWEQPPDTLRARSGTNQAIVTLNEATGAALRLDFNWRCDRTLRIRVISGWRLHRDLPWWSSTAETMAAVGQWLTINQAQIDLAEEQLRSGVGSVSQRAAIRRQLREAREVLETRAADWDQMQKALPSTALGLELHARLGVAWPEYVQAVLDIGPFEQNADAEVPAAP